MKKKILFEVDFKDWAFYFMVKSWSLKLADEYDCYYVCNEAYPFKGRKNLLGIFNDTFAITDLSGGSGHSYNQSPMTLWKNNKAGRDFFEKCAQIMANEPSRASLVMWKAAKELGISPYLLPTEWCVCGEDIGIGNEILLHVGHPKVSKFYNVKK